MKSSQSNFNLRSPGSYLVRSYLITTVKPNFCEQVFFSPKEISQIWFNVCACQNLLKSNYGRYTMLSDFNF